MLLINKLEEPKSIISHLHTFILMQAATVYLLLSLFVLTWVVS